MTTTHAHLVVICKLNAFSLRYLNCSVQVRIVKVSKKGFDRADEEEGEEKMKKKVLFGQKRVIMRGGC